MAQRKTPEERAASAALVKAVGEVAFGPTWVVALAAALGRPRLTINRWASGERIPSAADMSAMKALLADRSARISAVAKRIKAGPSPS